MTAANVDTSKWYLLALISGIIPLVSGIGIFLCWLVFRVEWLERAGLANVALGICLFGFGLICLIVYLIRSIKAGIPGYRKKALLAAAILLANFPAAGAIIQTVAYIVNAHTLIVENSSEFALTEFALLAGDRVHQMDDLSPGHKLQQTFRFSHEGKVEYSLRLKGVAKQGILYGYVTSGRGYTAQMTVTQSGEIVVE